VKRISFSVVGVASRSKGVVWGPIYSPHAFITIRSVRTSDMSDGEFKLAQIWLGRIYPMGLGYIRSKVSDMLLEPDEAQINPVGYIQPS
jgi:hypothetical protein